MPPSEAFIKVMAALVTTFGSAGMVKAQTLDDGSVRLPTGECGNLRLMLAMFNGLPAIHIWEDGDCPSNSWMVRATAYGLTHEFPTVVQEIRDELSGYVGYMSFLDLQPSLN
jgi:hypothetical protein